MQDVREIIGALIRERGFSQAVIARKAGMRPQQLCAVINMRRKLDANELFALCDAMEIAYSDVDPSKYAT